MKNILEQFLETIDVRYNKHFADKLYYEHPHRDNMYGLKRMLDVYGVKSLGVSTESKDLSALNYPCILHTYSGFVIGVECNSDTIAFLQHGKKTIVSYDTFKRMWTGNVLVIEETTDAAEPDYKEHKREELISMIKTHIIPIVLIISVIIGIIVNYRTIGFFDYIRMGLSAIGILACISLIEKQLFGESRYGDRVCSLFHQSDCNNVLDGPKAKFFGISWSEIGFGYFIANILLLSFIPASSCIVALINWIAMLYGVWSIYYQWRIAKSWCVLCVIVQLVIWAMGITAAFSFLSETFVLDIVNSLLSCIVFALSIIVTHQFALVRESEKERIRAVQQYRALKANSDVAKALIEKGDYHETTLNDSSIVFGNPKARMRVTILSNPHCNPCARMHKQVEELLDICGNEICVQYIFSSFNEKLEDSSRYLIHCYIENEQNEALRKYGFWYAKEKFDYESPPKNAEECIQTELIDREMEKHKMWRKKTSLIETPTILVNGYRLPHEYNLIDLAMIVSDAETKKNILQDINGRSTTPLGAESLSAEEAV